MQITKQARFEAGHRIPNHESKCRHVHGHSWYIQVTVEGPVTSDLDSPAQGMVTDFGDLKAILHEMVVDQWDHAFLVYDKDVPMIKALRHLPEGHRTVELHEVPTCENLARLAFMAVDAEVARRSENRTRVACVRLYETPNSWAEVLPRDVYNAGDMW